MLCMLLLTKLFAQQDTNVASNPVVADTLISTPADDINSNAPIAIRLTEKEVEATKAELISNNFFVKNNTDQAKNFYVDIALPGGWKFFGTNRMFNVAPGQEVVVPLRVLPTRLLGSTKFVVNILLFDEEDTQIGSEFFFVQSFKNVDWDVSVDKGNSIYFKNGENTSNFDISILNKGNYDQDLIMTMKGARKDFIIRDTSGKQIEEPKYSMSLNPMEDTSYSFEIETTREERNMRTISLQEHRPNTFLDNKTYSLYVNTAESKLSGDNLTRKVQKVDFKKLSNDLEVSPYPGPVLPLIVDANVQNVLTTNTFMNLVLRGFQSYDNGANLVYFNQFTFSSQYASNTILNNSSNYVGYFHPNFTAEAGNVAGVSFGMPAIGRGLKGSYRVYGNHWVGAYYVRQPRLFQPAQVENFGAFYRYQGTGRTRGNLGYAQSEDFLRNRNAQQVNGRISTKIAKSQTVTVLGAYSIRTSLNPITQQPENRNGYLIGANYSGRFINKKLSTNISGRYQSPTFGLTDNEKRILNSVIQYRTGLRNNLFFNSTLNENVFQIRNFDGTQTQVTNFVFYNLLGYSNSTDAGTFQYYGYYNVLALQSKRIESPGLGVRYSNYLFDRNILWTSDVRAGYDKAQFVPELPRYFVFRANGLVRWKTFNFVGGYFYGPNSPSAVENMIQTNLNPIYMRLGFGHQYLFRNTHFVMQNNLNYTYQNQSSAHRIGYFPELFYFTNDGWRFSANMNYSFATRKFNQSLPQFGSTQTFENLGERTSGQNFQVGVSVRKEFGIPIPFTKKKNYTKEFIAFYDLDGNSMRDAKEPLMENVVIRMGQNEVITNSAGQATLRNLPSGSYGYVVFSLEKLDGWFPNIQDSLDVFEKGTEYVPFVKGVKIYGEVMVDRQKLSKKLNKPLDLSNIKISAVSDKLDHHTLTDSKGAFEFYLPNGIYTLSMDESILGSNYSLVRNNFNVKMESGVEGVYVSFNIIERRREVKTKRFGSSENSLRKPGEEKPAPVKLPRRDAENGDDSNTEGQEEGNLLPGQKPTNLQNAASGQAPPGQRSNSEDPNDPASPDTDNNDQSIESINPEGASNSPSGTSTGRRGVDPELAEAEKNLPKRFIEPPITSITAVTDIMNIQNPDPDKIKYVVNFGTFVGKVPSNVVNHIIEMGYSNHVTPNQDTLKFMSVPVASQEEARQMLDRAVNAGFGDPPPQMQGSYDGTGLTLEQTRTLHERAKANRRDE